MSITHAASDLSLMCLMCRLPITASMLLFSRFYSLQVSYTTVSMNVPKPPP
jgi:hypothetical protein